MKTCKITEADLNHYRRYLVEDEKRELTIKKYIRDLQKFQEFLGERKITKNIVVEYKEYLMKIYSVSSVNSVLSSINGYLEFAGWSQFRVKHLKQQRKIYCPEEKELTKEEYFRLVMAAQEKQRERIGLIMQTICSTGIRVSELSYITAEAVKKGIISVECKGKYRQVFIPEKLREHIRSYMEKEKIQEGHVFVTRGGRSLDRSNIWREMKALCREAGIPETKVFPHNLRHLFAKTYYEQERDIVKLADLLGHSNVNTTRIYTITSGEEHRKQIERMELIL